MMSWLFAAVGILMELVGLFLVATSRGPDRLAGSFRGWAVAFAGWIVVVVGTTVIR